MHCLADFMAASLVELPPTHPEDNPWGGVFAYGDGQGTCLWGPSGDLRPHVELAIYWSPNNVQRVLASVDIGAGCSLIYGDPERFRGPIRGNCSTHGKCGLATTQKSQ